MLDGRTWQDRGGMEGIGDDKKYLSDIGTWTVSQLMVDRTQLQHSGRYTCSTLGSQGTWTTVHVLAGNAVSYSQLIFRRARY